MAAYTKEELDQIWIKGKVVSGQNPAAVRADLHGNTILRDSYGGTEKFSWEVDHIIPSSKGGGDDIRNLQPLQWEENREKSDNIA